MKTKGQHRGYCQACGAVQVIEPLMILAKHGYTVPNGYFRGTCQGSGHLPLQSSRVITDAIIKALIESAVRNEEYANDLLAGTQVPTRAQSLTEWGSRVYQSVNGKQTAVMVAWSAATEAERLAQISLETSESASHARFARSRAESLTELAARVHGQPLIDRDAEELARVAERKAKTAPITGAYRTKIEQKRALEALNNQYSKLARMIKDYYLAQPRGDRDDVKGDAVYWLLPHDLHCWRPKHTVLVLDAYPQFAKTVEAIEILVINRSEIKARPVIK